MPVNVPFDEVTDALLERIKRARANVHPETLDTLLADCDLKIVSLCLQVHEMRGAQGIPSDEEIIRQALPRYFDMIADAFCKIVVPVLAKNFVEKAMAESSKGGETKSC